MWYRKVLASLPGIATNSAGEKQSNLDQEIQGLNVQAEQLYPELEKMIKELNFDPKEY